MILKAAFPLKSESKLVTASEKQQRFLVGLFFGSAILHNEYSCFLT